MVRVADYIMSRIRQEGVNHIFYVPGGQCVYLTDALRRAEGIEGIATHHEQAAAMAAVGYACYNNNFGACLVTTGCAGTNTITGVLHAWQDSVPCIFVSGQQNIEQTIGYSGLPLRQVGIQEADIVGLVTPITKYAVMLTKPEEVAWQIEKAIYLAKSGRKGPVWIDVPLNIQNAMVDEDQLEHYEPEVEVKEELSIEDKNYIINCFKEAKRPVILAGQGVRSAEAVEELKKFAEKINVPVIFTRLAIDIFPYEHKLNYGVVCGFSGPNRYANFIVQNSDFVLSIGCRLSIDTTGSQQKDFARAAKIAVVDIDKVEHSKNGARIDKLIVADAKEFLTQMLEEELKKTDDWWIEKCNHWKVIFRDYDEMDKEKNPINAKYFLKILGSKLPFGSTIISDAGFTGIAVPANCHLSEGGRHLHSFAQGEMGYVLPASVGVACASRDMVVPISGDGSFMMNLQELQTIVRNQFNIKMVINNNNGYSGVRHGQRAHFRGKTIGTDMTNGVDFPDYSKIAVAFGIPYCRIENVTEIDEKLDEMINAKGPFICEVMTDPEQFELHNALVMYDKHKFAFRPIEDQSPFIDRDVFFEEMIVEPLETSYGKPV